MLDEADKMLAMGFEEQLQAISEAVPPERQALTLTLTITLTLTLT